MNILVLSFVYEFWGGDRCRSRFQDITKIEEASSAAGTLSACPSLSSQVSKSNWSDNLYIFFLLLSDSKGGYRFAILSYLFFLHIFPFLSLAFDNPSETTRNKVRYFKIQKTLFPILKQLYLKVFQFFVPRHWLTGLVELQQACFFQASSRDL